MCISKTSPILSNIPTTLNLLCNSDVSEKEPILHFHEATLHLGEAEENFLNDSSPDLKDVCSDWV
jgi:hypothetical protein